MTTKRTGPNWIGVGITVTIMLAMIIGITELVYQSRMREIEAAFDDYVSALTEQSRFEDKRWHESRKRHNEAVDKQAKLVEKDCPHGSWVTPNAYYCLPEGVADNVRKNSHCDPVWSLEENRVLDCEELGER